MGNLLTLVNLLLRVVDSVVDHLHSRKLINSGKAQARAEMASQALKDAKDAKDIDDNIDDIDDDILLAPEDRNNGQLLSHGKRTADSHKRTIKDSEKAEVEKH